MNYSTKASNGVLINLSLFMLTASATSSAAFADPFQQAAAVDFNGAVQGMSSSTAPCPGQASYPEAPSAVKRASRFQEALSYIKIGTSTELTKAQSKDGAVNLDNETLSATIGKVKISDLMNMPGIPPTEEPKLVLYNLNVTAAPAARVLVGTAEAGAVQNIQATEGSTTPWGKSDVKYAQDLGNTLKKNLIKQLTASVLVEMKSGQIYTCEAGKSPVTFVPNDSTNGSASAMQNATGGPSDGLDVGSAFSTILAKCTFAQSLKNDSKFMVGVEAYKGTRDDGGDLNRLFANAFFSNVPGNNANKLAAPNTFTVDGNYTKNIGSNTQVALNGKAGVTSVMSNEYFIYDGNGKVDLKGHNVMFNYGKNTTTSMTGTNPADPTTKNYAVNRTGAWVGYVTPSYRNFTGVVTAERDTHVSDASNATTPDGVIKLKKVAKAGVEYSHVTVHNPKADLLSAEQGETRLTAGVYFVDTKGYVKETGPSLGFDVKLETSGDWKSTLKSLGGQFKNAFPKKDNATVSTSEAYCSEDIGVDHTTVPRCTPAKDEKTPAVAPEAATNP